MSSFSLDKTWPGFSRGGGWNISIVCAVLGGLGRIWEGSVATDQGLWDTGVVMVLGFNSGLPQLYPYQTAAGLQYPLLPVAPPHCGPHPAFSRLAPPTNAGCRDACSCLLGEALLIPRDSSLEADWVAT